MARAMLEATLEDLPISRLCCKCGRRSLIDGFGKQKRERGRAVAFIRSERLDLWCQSAGLLAGEFRRESAKVARRYRKVCGCLLSQREQGCDANSFA